MIAFAATIEIAAEPARVWRLLMAVSREPEWMRAVRDVTFLDDTAAYQIGARMRRRGKFLWFEMVWESEITALEPERLASFRHIGGALRGESHWRLIDTEDGCELTLASTGPAPKPLSLFPSIAEADGRAGLKGDLARLKKLIETSTRSR